MIPAVFQLHKDEATDENPLKPLISVQFTYHGGCSEYAGGGISSSNYRNL